MEKKTEKELLQEVENLRTQVEKLKARKKYGLVWDAEREPEKVVLDCKKNLPILVEDKKKEIKGKNYESANLLIEGDNYHSLSVLNYTHKGKVDVIYIDPPYNTGNKHEWKYNDDWVDSEDRWRHSKWLNFMEKRLKLSKRLLSNDGIIFVSISYHECFQLKILMDDIFGEKNFVSNIIVKSNPRGKQQMIIPDCHEYLLVYAKNIDKVSLNSLDLDDSRIKEYNKIDQEGRLYREMGLRKRGAAARKIDVPTMHYSIYINPNNGKVSLEKDKYFSKEALPVLSNGEEGRWRWGKKKLSEEKQLLFGRLVNGERWDVFQYDYLEREGEQKGIKANSFWDEKEVNYENAKKELKDFFKGECPFDYPKTVYLMKKILKIASRKDSLILDFFAGSGTMGSAVLKANEDDQGKRKFILCTNNEDNNGDGKGVAEEICYPRLKMSIQGYKSQGGERVLGIPAELRYYKTDFVETENLDRATDQDKIELTYRAGEMIAIREETFEEIEKDEWWQIFSNEKEITAIYFKEDKSKLQKLVDKLYKMDKKVNLYIFSWGKNEYANEFPEYKNIKVKDIPEPLIEVYKEVANL